MKEIMQIDSSAPADSSRTQLQGVIFDYGNVLCLPQQPSDIEGMAAACALPLARFQQHYWKTRLQYDRGDLDGAAYWNGIARAEGRIFTPGLIEELIALDGKSWSRRNDATLRWVEQLRNAGLRLGVLSNMPADLKDYLVAHCDWFSLFDSLIFSCDVGLVKPDPAIYRLTLEKLKLAPAETLFLDDLAPNVNAAWALGIHSEVFENIELTAARVGLRFAVPVPAFTGIGL